MQKPKTRTLIQTSNTDGSYRFAVKPRYHPPSRDKIRQMALASHEGGRQRCDVCKMTFGAYYVRLVRNPRPFQEPLAACRDCREDHKLITI